MPRIHVVDLTVPHHKTWMRNQRKCVWRKTNFRERLRKHVGSARKRGLYTMFRNIHNHQSVAYFRRLVEGDCHYCGKKAVIQNERTGKYNGIARIDNDLGYVPGNCTTACVECNMAKGKMPCDAFIAVCSRVAVHRGH